MHAIAAEADDLAAFDAEAVLMLAPLDALGGDAVNAGAEVPAFEGKPLDGRAARIG